MLVSSATMDLEFYSVCGCPVRLGQPNLSKVALYCGATFLIACGLHQLETPARPLSEIIASGVLRVGVKVNLPPLAWRETLDTEGIDELANISGAWQGLEVEIARELATRLVGNEVGIEFIPLENTDRLQAVIDDRVDFAIAQIGITGDRLRLVSLTEPYYLDGTTVVVPAESELGSTLDLTSETIAVLAGSTAVATLNASASNLMLVGVESYQEGVDALQTGRVAGFAADATVMAGWVAENPDYRLLTPLLSGSGLAIALPKGNQYSELRRQVHSHMQELSESGWFEDQANMWGLP